MAFLSTAAGPWVLAQPMSPGNSQSPPAAPDGCQVHMYKKTLEYYIDIKDGERVASRDHPGMWLVCEDGKLVLAPS